MAESRPRVESRSLLEDCLKSPSAVIGGTISGLQAMESQRGGILGQVASAALEAMPSSMIVDAGRQAPRHPSAASSHPTPRATPIASLPQLRQDHGNSFMPGPPCSAHAGHITCPRALAACWRPRRGGAGSSAHPLGPARAGRRAGKTPRTPTRRAAHRRAALPTDGPRCTPMATLCISAARSAPMATLRTDGRAAQRRGARHTDVPR